MKTIDLLFKHRSIRKFTDQKIDELLLEKILLAGQCAASSSFVQAYSLVHVTDTSLLEQLVQLSGEQPYIASCSDFFVCCADLSRNKELCEKADHKAEYDFIEQMIIATVDTSLLAQNMVVAAESEGLGICYIGGIRNNPQQVCELLNLPEACFPLFGLCLGYPAQDPETKPRLPLPIWVHKNAYNAEIPETELAEYDSVVRHYYKTRTKNRKSDSWSEQMQAFLSKESRPHMLSFLHSRGLAKR